MDIHEMLNAEFTRAESVFANINKDQLSGRIDFAKNKNQQPVLNVPKFNHLRIFSQANEMIIEPATSDDDSGPENLRPTLGDVADGILDSKMLQFSPKFCPVPYQNPTLIFFHVSPQLKRRRFQSTVSKDRSNVISAKIADYTSEAGKIRSAIAVYGTMKDAKKAYEYYKLKEDTQTLGQVFKTNEMGTQCSVLWMVDRSKDPSSRWAGLVIRNLNLNSTWDQVRMLMNEQILRIESLKMIRGEICALVIVKDVDIAERIWNNLNKKKLSGGNRILVHLHPNTNMWLRPKNTHHMFLLQESQQEEKTVKKPKVIPQKPARQFTNVQDLLKSFYTPKKSNTPVKTNPLDALIKPK